MARPPQIPKNQHYVPRMLMRPFGVAGAGKFEQVQVFDKHTDRAFTARLEDVLAGRYFNTVWDEDYIQDVEGPLAKLEDRSAPVLRKLVTERSWANLNGEEQVTLAFFLAIQFLRGPDTRARIDQMMEAIQERTEALAADGKAVEAVPTADERKQLVFGLMRNSAGDMAKMLLQKSWLLFEPESGEFYLGDTPLALHNDREFGPYGNLGLALPGIQIYVPLAPDLMLALWCPSLVAELQQAHQNLKQAVGLLTLRNLVGAQPLSTDEAALLAEISVKLPATKAMVAAVESKTPLKSDPSNMRFLNHLQVRSAERYVLARNEPFDLVEEMVKHREGYRRGLRLTF